jgi:hypothetical protein
MKVKTDDPLQNVRLWQEIVGKIGVTDITDLSEVRLS